MADADRVRWDQRYAERGPGPGRDIGLPTVFAAFADQFPTPGRAVELACGAGEASVWLAQRGLHVWGWDVSPVAVGQARQLAEDAGYSGRCRFEVVDLDDGLPVGEPADVLLCNKFRDRSLDAAIVERLAPGGLLAIGVLSEVGASPGSFRARRGELVEAFTALEVIDAGEGDGEAWLLGRRR